MKNMYVVMDGGKPMFVCKSTTDAVQISRTIHEEDVLKNVLTVPFIDATEEEQEDGAE